MSDEKPKEAPKGYKVVCGRCGDKEVKKVHHFNDGSDNIDGFSHYHLECLNCGLHFGLWGPEVTKEQIKKAYGEGWEQYW